jgi:hypothetical protein
MTSNLVPKLDKPDHVLIVRLVLSTLVIDLRLASATPLPAD